MASNESPEVAEVTEHVPAAYEPPPAFGGELVFSKPRSSKKESAEAFSVSVVLHTALAIAAVYLTLIPPKKDIAKEDILIPMVVQDEAQKDLPKEPDKPKPVDMAEIPKGFQTLAMPTVIPPDIPPPTAGPEINEADFSGEGREGGLAKGKNDPNATRTVTAEDLAAAPVFTPYTVEPILKNRSEVADLLVRMYPPMLRDMNMGGTVLVWVFVDATGTVRNTRVKTSSGLTALDSAAIKVTSRMQFQPAQNRDVKVPVWVALPIKFTVQ